jgi:hypothetical protein
MVQEKLNFDIAKKYFKYDSESGLIFWSVTNNRKKQGEEAGLIHKTDGYKVLTLFSKQYKYHRVAWLLHYGDWPKNVIDHINGDKLDNRISNLRDVCLSQNSQNQTRPAKNNKSGYLGVSRAKSKNKWKSTIKVDGKTKTIGTFDTPEKAHEAYVVAKRQHHAGCTI